MDGGLPDRGDRRVAAALLLTGDGLAWRGDRSCRRRCPGAARCVKDLIEERLFERRRDLFSDLSLVFVDTTSLAFDGTGGESLGAYGHSKDHWPDLKQMILAVVIDGEGWPICTQTQLEQLTRGRLICFGWIDEFLE